MNALGLEVLNAYCLMLCVCCRKYLMRTSAHRGSRVMLVMCLGEHDVYPFHLSTHFWINRFCKFFHKRNKYRSGPAAEASWPNRSSKKITFNALHGVMLMCVGSQQNIS